MNPLCEALGIEIPIIQAPTASIAGPELAAAVSSAGALGSMGLTWTSPGDAVAQIAEVRAVTQAPFLVNFALAFEPAALPDVLRAGAPIVSFSWGDPSPHLAEVRSAGAKVGIQVGNEAGARRARELGADFIICQGMEAGGHVQSTTPLESLLPMVIHEAREIPVVAAGGISTGVDIARVLALGAQGAMLGTRFVATRESRAHGSYKQRLVDAGDTALTMCFDGGWPHAAHRVLRNDTLEAWESAGCPQPGRRPGEGEPVGLSASGEPILRYEDTAPRQGMTGDIDSMALYAGEGVTRITDLPSAGTLVRRLWAEALAHLKEA